MNGRWIGGSGISAVSISSWMSVSMWNMSWYRPRRMRVFMLSLQKNSIFKIDFSRIARLLQAAHGFHVVDQRADHLAQLIERGGVDVEIPERMVAVEVR